MCNKNELIDKLFVDWKRRMMTDSMFAGRPFIKDGIIDPERYSEQKIKVLFLSNESNIENYDVPEGDDDVRKSFREYIEDKHDKWAGKLRERVSCLYQVIIKDFSEEPYKVADRFAFINLNKSGGGSNIDNRISLFCKRYSNELVSQIEIINPDLIVWLGCNTFDNKTIRENCLGVISDGTKYYFNSVPVIRMWHTASRCRGERLKVFDNPINDKLAYKLRKELNKLEIN